MGNLTSQEEGVVETPGQSSTAEQPSSVTRVTYQEVVTTPPTSINIGLDREMQSGVAVTTGAHLRGSNVISSQQFGRPECQFEHDVRVGNSGVGDDAAVGSSRTQYDLHDRSGDEERSLFRTPAKLLDYGDASELGDSLLYWTAQSRVNMSRASLLDSPQDIEDFVETMRRRAQIRTPLSYRPEFAGPLETAHHTELKVVPGSPSIFT